MSEETLLKILENHFLPGALNGYETCSHRFFFPYKLTGAQIGISGEILKSMVLRAKAVSEKVLQHNFALKFHS